MSLWKNMYSPRTRICIKCHPVSRETSLSTCQKASMTMEAAVILPLFTSFLLMLLSMFYLLRVQAEVEEALIFAGRKVAAESSVVEEEAVLFLSAEGYLLFALRKEPLIEKYVTGGSLGVVLLGSRMDGDYIRLKAYYSIELPVGILGKKTLLFRCGETFRKWNGDHRIVENEEEQALWVYVTETGEVYHRTMECRTIKRNVESCLLGEIQALRGENGQKYYPCPRCAESISRYGRVYYTAYGSLYHEKSDCSYLKRTVSKIPISEIGNRRPCSYCYEGR